MARARSGGDARVPTMPSRGILIGPSDLPFVVVVLGMHRIGPMVVVIPKLPLELVLVRGLRPKDLVQALLRKGMDVPRLDALRLHPHDETDAHAYVLVLGPLDVVGELQLGPRSMDVGLG